MVSFNRQAARALTLSVALAAAGVLVTAGSAHHEPPVLFDAATAVTTPTIDGVVGADEWADTPGHFVLFGELSGTVRFKHGLGYLYGSLTVSDPGLDSKLATFYFDDDHDGQQDPGDDAVVVRPEGGADDFYFSAAGGRAGSTATWTAAARSRRAPAAWTTSNQMRQMRAEWSASSSGIRSARRTRSTTSASIPEARSDSSSNQAGPDNFFNPGANGVDASDWGDLLISADPAATTQIVFETNRDGQLEIYKMNADGSAPTQLSNNPAVDNLPSISPTVRTLPSRATARAAPTST